MHSVITVVEQHVLWLVFLNVLLAQSGLPLPVFPTLMTAGALAGNDSVQIGAIVLAGAGGGLLGDLAPYWYGRRYGRRVLGLLCRLSFSPDFCVRQTENVFARIGPWSLLFAKFIPGISLISVAMAGVTRMPAILFLVLDGIGKSLFVGVGVGVALGWVFRDAIGNVLVTLTEFGKFGAVAVVAALALYVLAKWWRRHLFIRQLRMDRITVAELRDLVEDGTDLAILDVRPKEICVLEGVIPGAILAHAADIDPIVKSYPRDREVVVYCACPNEESAAMAAKHLRQVGFTKIRPLLGGIDAWIEAGQPVQNLQSADNLARAA